MVGYAGAAAFGRIARPRLAASGRNPAGGPWAAAAVVVRGSRGVARGRRAARADAIVVVDDAPHDLETAAGFDRELIAGLDRPVPGSASEDKPLGPQRVTINARI